MADLTTDKPTTTPPEAREVRLRDALLDDKDHHALDALAQQQAKAEQLEQKLLDVTHRAFNHGAVAAQEAIASLNKYRDAFEIEARGAFAIAKTGTMDDFVDALRFALSPHITSALSKLREIESANGQAGWCIHQKPKAAPNGWTATREGAVVRLALVKP